MLCIHPNSYCWSVTHSVALHTYTTCDRKLRTPILQSFYFHLYIYNIYLYLYYTSEYANRFARIRVIALSHSRAHTNPHGAQAHRCIHKIHLITCEFSSVDTHISCVYVYDVHMRANGTIIISNVVTEPRTKALTTHYIIQYIYVYNVWTGWRAIMRQPWPGNEKCALHTVATTFLAC